MKKSNFVLEYFLSSFDERDERMGVILSSSKAEEQNVVE